MLNRKQAMALTKRLDKIATHVEAKYASIGLSKKEAYDFCLYLDETSDLLERAAEEHDEYEDEEVDAALLREEDEPYMDTFDNAHAPHQVEDDEPYMDHFEEDPNTQVVDADDLAPMNDGEWGVSANTNWYEQSKRASTSNWYERTKNASNWYERSKRNR